MDDTRACECQRTTLVRGRRDIAELASEEKALYINGPTASEITRLFLAAKAPGNVRGSALKVFCFFPPLV